MTIYNHWLMPDGVRARHDGVDVDEIGHDAVDADVDDLMRALGGANDLGAVRSVAARLPVDRHDTRSWLIVAARVCLLVCVGIDELLRRDSGGHTGATHDTGIYRSCRSAGAADQAGARLGDTEVWLRELAVVCDKAAGYLWRLRVFDGYADLIANLVDRTVFWRDSDDIVIHRCLLAWHAVAEVYMRALQGQVTPTVRQDGFRVSRFPKGDVKDAVLRTARGPILGHHQIMTLNCATCSEANMSPRKAFTSYKENLRWFNDWATANRGDGDIMAALDASMTGHTCSDPACGAPVDEPDGGWMWRERNAVGEGLSRWLARLDHVTKSTSNGSYLHTGVLCGTSEAVRKMTIACVSYGSYHFWPVHRRMSLDDYVRYTCASIGEMQRGWAIDHDSEAAAAEHNLLNWACTACATYATQQVLLPANTAADREDWEMRTAWGPQTYFYFGGRHHGFARRVDNLRGRLTAVGHGLSIQPTHRRCDPISSGDTLPVVISKLLALCGAAATAPTAVALSTEDWDCQPRICADCAFDGYRAQLFMLSVGAARLAAMLPNTHRQELTRLLDTYGFRLFPAVQARLLVQCSCVPRWTADVMSHGYADAGTACGQSACVHAVSAPALHPMPVTAVRDEDDEYDGHLLRDVLLRQAHIEARRYASRTGRVDWLSVVSQPLQA